MRMTGTTGAVEPTERRRRARYVATGAAVAVVLMGACSNDSDDAGVTPQVDAARAEAVLTIDLVGCEAIGNLYAPDVAEGMARDIVSAVNDVSTVGEVTLGQTIEGTELALGAEC